MAVQDAVARVVAQGNGSARTFPFAPVILLAAGDLEVLHVDADGEEHEYASNSYDVNVSSYPGTGSVTFDNAPPDGRTLVFRRNLPYSQLTQLSTQSAYDPRDVEAALDRVTLLAGQAAVSSALDADELEDLEADDIPDLPASKITSGQFDDDRIPNLQAGKIINGEFDSNLIPNLPANRIVTGSFDADRIPGISADKTIYGEFHVDRIPDIPVAKVPNLSANKITSDRLNKNRLPEGYGDLFKNAALTDTTLSFTQDDNSSVDVDLSGLATAVVGGTGSSGSSAGITSSRNNWIVSRVVTPEQLGLTGWSVRDCSINGTNAYALITKGNQARLMKLTNEGTLSSSGLSNAAAGGEYNAMATHGNYVIFGLTGATGNQFVSVHSLTNGGQVRSYSSYSNYPLKALGTGDNTHNIIDIRLEGTDIVLRKIIVDGTGHLTWHGTDHNIGVIADVDPVSATVRGDLILVLQETGSALAYNISDFQRNAGKDEHFGGSGFTGIAFHSSSVEYLTTNKAMFRFEEAHDEFTDHIDTPDTIEAGKVVVGNAAGTALEFADAASGGGGDFSALGFGAFGAGATLVEKWIRHKSYWLKAVTDKLLRTTWFSNTAYAFTRGSGNVSVRTSGGAAEELADTAFDPIAVAIDGTHLDDNAYLLKADHSLTMRRGLVARTLAIGGTDSGTYNFPVADATDKYFDIDVDDALAKFYAIRRNAASTGYHLLSGGITHVDIPPYSGTSQLVRLEIVTGPPSFRVWDEDVSVGSAAGDAKIVETVGSVLAISSLAIDENFWEPNNGQLSAHMHITTGNYNNYQLDRNAGTNGIYGSYEGVATIIHGLQIGEVKIEIASNVASLVIDGWATNTGNFATWQADTSDIGGANKSLYIIDADGNTMVFPISSTTVHSQQMLWGNIATNGFTLPAQGGIITLVIGKAGGITKKTRVHIFRDPASDQNFTTWNYGTIRTSHSFYYVNPAGTVYEMPLEDFTTAASNQIVYVHDDTATTPGIPAGGSNVVLVLAATGGLVAVEVYNTAITAPVALSIPATELPAGPPVAASVRAGVLSMLFPNGKVAQWDVGATAITRSVSDDYSVNQFIGAGVRASLVADGTTLLHHAGDFARLYQPATAPQASYAGNDRLTQILHQWSVDKPTAPTVTWSDDGWQGALGQWRETEVVIPAGSGLTKWIAVYYAYRQSNAAWVGSSWSVFSVGSGWREEQYSSDGASWHTTKVSADIWMRIRKSDDTWSTPILVANIDETEWTPFTSDYLSIYRVSSPTPTYSSLSLSPTLDLNQFDDILVEAFFHYWNGALLIDRSIISRTLLPEGKTHGDITATNMEGGTFGKQWQTARSDWTNDTWETAVLTNIGELREDMQKAVFRCILDKDDGLSITLGEGVRSAENVGDLAYQRGSFLFVLKSVSDGSGTTISPRIDSIEARVGPGPASQAYSRLVFRLWGR